MMNEQIGKAPPVKLDTWGQRTRGLIVGVLVGGAFLFVVTGGFHTHHHAGLARRTICASNLSSLGKAIITYQSFHGFHDRAPTTWTAFAASEEYLGRKLVCPESGTQRAQINEAADLQANCDYVLLVLHEGAAENMLQAFELPVNHGQKGLNALTVNAAVTWQDDLDAFRRQLRKANEFLIRPQGANE